jgi:hypothetical protein
MRFQKTKLPLATVIRQSTSVTYATEKGETDLIAMYAESRTARVVGISSFSIQALRAILMNEQMYEFTKYCAQAYGQRGLNRSKKNCIEKMRARPGSEWLEKEESKSPLSRIMVDFGR